MADPFVLPREASAAEAIAAIGEDLAVLDEWEDRYRYLIDLGRELPAFPPQWADDAHRVPGCQSQVWMEAVFRDGRLYFAGTSDAAIVAGLIAVLLRVYSGRTPAEILATDPRFMQDLGLLAALSTNRGNGVAAMARRLREVAAFEAARQREG
jgi:cysteine desulfuration protein SufE